MSLLKLIKVINIHRLYEICWFFCVFIEFFHSCQRAIYKKLPQTHAIFCDAAKKKVLHSEKQLSQFKKGQKLSRSSIFYTVFSVWNLRKGQRLHYSSIWVKDLWIRLSVEQKYLSEKDFHSAKNMGNELKFAKVEVSDTAKMSFGLDHKFRLNASDVCK